MNIFFYNEIAQAKKLIQERSYDAAFLHLENAHIIGQTSIKLHTISHLYMLKIAIFSFDLKEILGQLIRIPLGIIGSALGIVPLGNSGGSNVSMFAKMDIPTPLEEFFTEKN